MATNSNPWGVPTKKNVIPSLPKVLADYSSNVKKNIKSGTADTGKIFRTKIYTYRPNHGIKLRCWCWWFYYW